VELFTNNLVTSHKQRFRVSVFFPQISNWRPICVCNICWGWSLARRFILSPVSHRFKEPNLERKNVGWPRPMSRVIRRMCGVAPSSLYASRGFSYTPFFCDILGFHGGEDSSPYCVAVGYQGVGEPCWLHRQDSTWTYCCSSNAISSSSVTLQFLKNLDQLTYSFMWVFVTRNFIRGGIVSVTPNPQPGGLLYYPLTCLAWVTLPGVPAPASIALGVIRARKPPHPQHVLRQGGNPWGGPTP
jgi:hypothetical protein